MIKTTYLIAFLLITLLLHGQITLTYNNHSLQINDIQHSTIASYVKPGEGGKNVVWDFSKLECINEHSASVVAPEETPHFESFPKSNAVIYEHGNYFYYSCDENKTQYLGYVKPNIVIKYDQPLTRMAYPFSYKDRFTKHYTGGTIVSEIKGHYAVEADAYGTLILPGNIVLENTLRIKVKEQFIETACNSVVVITTKYLWYTMELRNPVMVIFERKENYSNGKHKDYKYTVFQSNIPQSKSLANTSKYFKADTISTQYQIFPNPYTDHVNINYLLQKDCKTDIEVYTTNGALVKTIASKNQTKGPYSYAFYPKKYYAKPATYFIKLVFGDEVHLQKIIGVE